MAGEHERKRSEPSFSEPVIDRPDGQEPGAQLDLNQLLDEIGESMANAPPRHHNGRVGETNTSSVGGAPPPKQSMLDFGGVEHSSERIAPLPGYTDDNLSGDEPMSRGVMMAGGALIALSLLCGTVGLFVAFSASGKLEALQQSVDTLQTKLATMQVSGDPRVGQLQAEQAGLTSRIDELVMKVDALTIPPAKGSDTQLVELRKRLETLERKASQPVKNVAATAPTTKSASNKPAASSGDWAVILVSFPTSAQAESERTRLQKLGLRAEVFKSAVDGKPWFRVRVPGYASQESAKTAIPALESKSGITGAWVAHR